MKGKFLGSVTFILIFFGFSSYTFKPEPTGPNENLLKYLMTELHRYHYQRQAIDDSFSRKVFNEYMDKLDPFKEFFTQSDVELMEGYKDEIDDQIMQLRFDLFDLSKDIFFKRLVEVPNYYKEILAQPFDFSEDESFEIDFDKLPFAKDQEELKDYWRKRLKYEVLRRLTRKLTAQEKLAETAVDSLKSGDSEDSVAAKSFEELEAESRAEVEKTYNSRFEFLKKRNDTDLRSLYLNSIANIYDPHTVYFAPKAKEEFDIRMSGSFEGIGARLVERDGLITVTEIIVGGPAYRKGELEAGDKILRVGQADESPVDVVGMRTDDAVLMIRGKKGTEVRLTVRKSDGSERVLSIIRDVVQIEETFAKSVILQDEGDDRKVGYIFLPQFYTDFDDPKNGRRCSRDVAKEIKKLKSESVESIILDLRDNGGGSLTEVIDMTGLFIEKGPVVQVKSRIHPPTVMEDKDPGLQYDGPLIVMVNELSASASEILAAAIQDYDRGIIVGSSASSFGKGTVQRIQNLSRYEPQGPNLGGLKVTIQKFYRIDGGATQLKGVVPDVVLPSRREFIPIGEKEEKYSIAWDEIEPVAHRDWKETLVDEDHLRSLSAARVGQNETFSLIKENALYLKEQREKTKYPLILEDYRNLQEEITENSKKYRSIYDPIEGFDISMTAVDAPVIAADSNLVETWDKWIESLTEDPYLYETLQIALDMGNELHLSGMTKPKGKK
ncbi:MAG: carboxy terminal-processing peptidase [Bacteroidota bacterium]